MRLGLIADAALGLSREESQFNFRGAFRLNFPLNDVLDGRTDFVLGGFSGFLASEESRSHTSFGAGLRAALQLNLGPVYTLDLGTEVVLAFSGGLVGAHASVLGFRFGPKGEVYLSFPVQFWQNFSSRLVLEHAISVSYLFGP